MGLPGDVKEREWGRKKIFEELMAEKFPKLLTLRS